MYKDNCLNCFFILPNLLFQAKIKNCKKNKKKVDNVEYIWYIINALEKKKMQMRKKFFENWAKCQFE